MYLNIPVILLIDPKADQFKSEYDQYYEDLKEGLTCIISIKVHEPHFERQTKTKLGNLEIK